MDTPVLLLSGCKPHHMAAVQREDFITLLLSRTHTVARPCSLSRLGTFRDSRTRKGTGEGDVTEEAEGRDVVER